MLLLYAVVSISVSDTNSKPKRNDDINTILLNALSQNMCMKNSMTKDALTDAIAKASIIPNGYGNCPAVTTVKMVRKISEKNTANNILTGAG